MQLNIRASVTDRGALGGVPGAGLNRRLSIFVAEVDGARQRAAQTATSTSRSNVRRVRDLAPVRKGRYHGLRDAIRWRPIGTGAGVGLALQELNQKFPPWLVQEIGTGQRAIQRVAGQPNPVGRPTKGAHYVKTVRPQRGRRINNFLVFATRGGQYTPPGAATGQQLYLRSQIKGAPVRYDPRTQRSAAGIRISKEIKGQHFIQRGAEAGFREYRGSVLTAARQQLKKRRR